MFRSEHWPIVQCVRRCVPRRMPRWIWVIGLLLGCVVMGAPRAQDDSIEGDFRRVSSEDEQRYRATLAQPVPAGVTHEVLRQHFFAKENAARRLSDRKQWIAVERAAIERLPDPVFRHTLSRLLFEEGEIAEARKLAQEAIRNAIDPVSKAFYLSGFADSLYYLYRYDEAQNLLVEARKMLEDAGRSTRGPQRPILQSRTQRQIAMVQSLIDQRRGRRAAAVTAALESERHARHSLRLVGAQRDNLVAQSVVRDLALTMARKTQALRDAGRLGESERALGEYLGLSREVELPPAYLAGIYRVAADLRMTQREFRLAEEYARKSDAVLERLGMPLLHTNRVIRQQIVLLCLWAQGRNDEASALLASLDQAAGNDAQLRQRVNFRFERGLIYLSSGRPALAYPLFDRIASSARTTYGADHFFVVQARGLQGVALWRTAEPGNRQRAQSMLADAVRGYMAPANVDYLENVLVRKEVRELIFATYLEAMATASNVDGNTTLVAADWVRGGVVQESLADAAIRAAINNPALAELVRREQDVKYELLSLRRMLEGEPGESAPAADVAAEMRARAVELESQRSALQNQLSRQFPDHERLVRPPPIAASAIVRALARDEALLLYVPTESAVFAWLVRPDGNTRFLRLPATQSQVDGLVKRLRDQLDLAGTKTRPTSFDGAPAQELHQMLLAPFKADLAGTRHLVIAANGTLSQLPFGVLLTDAMPVLSADAPWLVRQFAITQAPGVSAWLSTRTFARSQRATEAFIGWGDPVFKRDAMVAPVAPREAAPRRLVERVRMSVDLEKQFIDNLLRYEELPTLPETREELQAIAGVLRADPARDLRLGARATREDVLESNRSGELARKRVVVFATHGLVAGDLLDLNQPALAMSAGAGASRDSLASLLTLQDVLSLKLNADWVVLSACNTAAADGLAEESLSGLARGFFFAGSRSLLVTHWAVETESARLITTATFDHYARVSSATKAESLRQAMLKLIAQPRFMHPAFWAPFSVVGDGGR